MGNSHSFPAAPCLLSAVDNNPSLIALPDQFLYQISAVKPYNLNVPVCPVAVTFPESAQQIASIVKCAVDHGYKVQARSGGHSYSNHGLGGEDDTIVVDMKHFQQFSMDPYTNVATIGSGMLLESITFRMHNAGGRAMSHGACPQVGAGGHLTIGGLGPTSRQFGSSLDHVEEVEMVLANSSIVRASKKYNQDLFFAARGAAASFGIVTEFKVRTESAPTEVIKYVYRVNRGNASERAQLIKDWQSFVADPELSRKFSVILTVMKRTILITGQFYGNDEEYKKLGFEDYFPIDRPGDLTAINYIISVAGRTIERFALKIGGSIPTSFYAKSMAFTPKTLMPASTIDELVRHLDTANSGSSLWFINLDLESGAVNDVPMNATAYAHRDVLYWVQTYIINISGSVSQTSLDFVSEINKIVCKSVPEACRRAYPGYVDPLMPNAQQAYWGPNLARLQKIKAAVDPADVFHNPQSVRVRGSN